ncbi:hypothetical protein [Pseudomonas chlororaphis]
MSEVKRFRADHRHVVETEFDDAQFVGVADFDRVTAERDAALLELSEIKESLAYRGSLLCRIEGQRDALQQRLTAADERADALEGLLREVSSSCALTWEDNQPTAEALELQDRIDAALKPAEGGGDEV